MKSDKDSHRTYVLLNSMVSSPTILALSTAMNVYGGSRLASWRAGRHCCLLTGAELAYLKSLMYFIWACFTLSSAVRDEL